METEKPDDIKPAANELNPSATPALPASSMLVLVQFEKSWSVYNKGETAGFAPDKADWLLKKKMAVKA